MRKILAGLLLMMAPFVAQASFSDVAPDHTNEQAISYVQDQSIVQGYPDGTFRPDRPVNRAEFLKILILAVSADFNPAECQHTRSFPDVPLTEWFNDYVCIGKDRGYVKGYPDGTFRPTQTITFVEAAKIMTNAFQLDSRFEMITDSEMAPPWFAQYVAALDDHHAIPLTIDSAGHFLTRGEMAEMIWRIMANVTDQPSKTYQDFQGATAPTVFEQIKQWTPGIQWSGVQSELFPDSIVVDDNRTIPARSIDSQFISFPRRNVGRALHQNIVQNGWSTHIYLDADGVTGSQWGYQKSEGDALRFLIFREIASQCTANVNAPGATCASHETRVYATEPVSAAASSIGSAYTNTHDGYSIDLPSGWTAQENMQVDDRLNGAIGNATGTKFSAAQSDQPFIFTAITPSCPDLSKGFLPTPHTVPPKTVTINGRTFFTLYLTDGAAGSVGEVIYYTSRMDATHCFVMATLFFHSTGEALDEPMRSQVKAQNAQMNQTLSDIVQSIRMIGQ